MTRLWPAAADILRGVKARAYVRVIGANREISWVVTEIVLPILSVTAYVFLYRALNAPPMFEGLVILGGAMIPFWIVVLWSMAMQFYWEKEMGNLDIYLSSPTDPIALLLGMAVGGMVMGALRTIAILILGVLLFKIQFVVTSWPMLIVILTLTLSALFAMGMAAASVYFVTGRKGVMINIALMEPVFLLTGNFFPLKNLGAVLGAVASIIPISLGLDGVRQLLLPGFDAYIFLSVETEAAILLAMTLVFGTASVFLVRRMERKGLADGTLAEKWL